MDLQRNAMVATSGTMTPCDFLLIIALEEEFRYFLNALNVELHPENADGINYYTFQLPAPRGNYAEGVVSFMGEMGILDAHSRTHRLISLVKPGLVVNIGISGIINDYLKLGDVVVATAADDLLHRSKVVQEDPSQPLSFKDLQFGGRSFPTTNSFHEKLKGLKVDAGVWSTWVNNSINQMKSLFSSDEIRFLKEKGLIDDKVTKVEFGPVTSGPWVGASEQFKRILRQNKNRNYLAMDMEAAGVLYAAHEHELRPQTLVLRAMSDPADERKDQLDKINGGAIRNWSMSNASRVFKLLIEKVEIDSYSKRDLPIPADPTASIKEAADKLQETVVNHYLEFPYKDIFYLRKYSYKDYSDLFSIILDSKPKATETHLFEETAKTILSSGSVHRLQLKGLPGTGKTSFLSILYWYFFDQYNQSAENHLPVFISLHHYNEPLSQRDTSMSLQAQVTNVIERDLAPLNDFIGRFPSQPLLIIVDGYDEFARFQNAAWNYLLNLLKTCHHLKVVGSREDLDGKSIDYNNANFDIIQRLCPVHVNNSLFHEFINAFLRVSLPSTDAAIATPIKQTIKRIKLKEVDLFTLSLLVEHYRNPRSDSSQTLSAILQNYCQGFLNHRLASSSQGPGALDRAAQIAFNFVIKNEQTAGDEDEDRAFLDLIRQHIRISDFLVAYFAVNQLFNINKNNTNAAENLAYVYPSRINRLCKELINKNSGTQQKAAAAIKSILEDEGVHPYAKAQACYFAGRLEAPQAQFTAKKALSAVQDSFKRAEEKGVQEQLDNPHLLLWRSLYIALVYLGDTNAQLEYVEGLLSDGLKDSVNRGFHLEYYGDQRYDSSEMLTNKDLLGEYANTFEQLYSNLKSTGLTRMFEIELHTLCSLAQHRHPLGKLKETDRLQLISLLDDFLLNYKIKNPALRSYVRMVNKHLKQADFKIASAFDNYYKIKRTKRSGWVKRGINNGESVADHSFGAYLLALFLLPDASHDKEYSKETIMNMLLAHDLSEAITGDVLPDDKDEKTDREELEVYEEIKMLGTYDAIGRMGRITALWKEFKSGTTLNALVAKDLDRLENLVQLWIYKNEGHNLEDYEGWRQEILNDVKTPAGILVMEKLLAFYEKKIESH